MSEHKNAHLHPEDTTISDHDLKVRPILELGIALAVLILVSMVLMWWLSVGLKKSEEKAGATTSPLAEVQDQQPPPFPRLQSEPEEELKQLHAEEERVLGSYGWVDRGQGIVRIPIEQAIDLVAGQGLQAPAKPAEEVAP